MMKNGGKNVVYFPCFGYGANDLSRQVQLLEDESTVLSLADTGAHCGVLCDASVPTQMLSYYVRDRQRGHRLKLEDVVKMQTHDTARCVGLDDRGTLEVGMKADLNLIDFDELQLEAPQIIFDLPAGGRRMFQGARGYVATIVSGEVIMENGQYTGAVPGTLIRGTQAAPAQSGLTDAFDGNHQQQPAPEHDRRGGRSRPARQALSHRYRHGELRRPAGFFQRQRGGTPRGG